MTTIPNALDPGRVAVLEPPPAVGAYPSPPTYLDPAALQIKHDRIVQALNERHARTVDRYNALLRFCQAIPLLIEVEAGRSDRLVRLDQIYLDRLAALVEACREKL